MNITEMNAAVSDAELAAINRLLNQLTTEAKSIDRGTMERVLSASGTHVYLLRDGESRICAMATLCVCVQLTGTKAWVEDVVCAGDCRGRGYGRMLIRHLTEEARIMGAESVNLTSRPSRVAANKLYRSEGFEPRETNVYKLQLQ